MKNLRSLTLTLALALPLAACGSSPAATPDASTQDAAAPMFDPAVCRGDVVQPDLSSQDATGAPIPPAWMGPGVDSSTGLPSVPEGAIITTTYLQLRVDEAGQRRFGELVGPVIGQLMATPGMIAVSLTNSRECGVARTLTVWQDEESMLAFVASDAHTAAMVGTAEVSRGGSITTHWIASGPDDASWARAAERLADHDGPVY